MKLTARLAYSQIKANRKRAFWTLMGIALSTGMIIAVFGFAFAGIESFRELVHDNLRDVYHRTFWLIGAVLSSVIMASSIIVISNSFRVSAGERLAQFGILKSVGATKAQIAATVMYESLFLSAIGIPAGIIVGMVVQFAGTEIANLFLTNITHLYAAGTNVTLQFVVAWQAIIVSVILGFCTVLLSAWFPAHKAAKIPAINAIRKAGEVKVKPVRASWLVRKLFGFEGMLASKTVKRNRRNMRATVVSLSISITLFVVASSFSTHLNRLADVVMHLTDADVIGDYMSTVQLAQYGDEFTLYYYPIDNVLAEQITARLREFPDTSIIGAGNNINSFAMSGIAVPVDMLTAPMYDRYSHLITGSDIVLNMSLLVVDAQTYAELVSLAGVPHGSNILINYNRAFINDIWTEFTPFVFDGQTLTLQDREYTQLTLHGELRYYQVPREVIHMGRGSIVIIVPELNARAYSWYAQTNDPSGFIAFMQDVFYEMLPRSYSGIELRTNIRNLQAEQAGERAIIQLVVVFTYGFVGLLTLIGLTNVISTISTNVRSRAREFAVLQSVGMSGRGLNKMLALESILCSARSLLFGLPLGIGASVLVYRGILISAQFNYIFPLVAVVQCVFAVFIITWATMRYASSKLKNNNIIDTIRGDGN